MSIKSEKFPDDFEEMFKRFDSTDRDKKDVAFSIWCELEKLRAENKAIKDSRDELLDALKWLVNWGQAIPSSKHYKNALTQIKKAEALKEK